MSGPSPIEWTERTWNPVVGCSVKSPGCTNCYAMAMAARIEVMGSAPHYAGTTRRLNGNAVFTGKIAEAPEATLLEPLRRRKPTTYFVNSMGDLFHENVPHEVIDRVFAVMALCPQHIFQVLTKRSARMRAYLGSRSALDEHGFAAEDIRVQITAKFASSGKYCKQIAWPLPNIWLGVSTERQQEADERIPDLLATPAAVRFISAEPLLSWIDLKRIKGGAGWQDVLSGWRHCEDYPGREETLDWVIVGGESGPDARPMHPDWARLLRDQCTAAGVPFFFKQWGAWSQTHPDWPRAKSHALADDGTLYDPADLAFPDGARRGEAIRAGHNHANLTSMYRIGKAKAGRLLDGVEHNGMPEARA
jgi:protein gp37